MSMCTGPMCDREAVAKGLCPSHLRQKQRGRPLTPLRTGPRGVALSTRVPEDVSKALGEEPGTMARVVLTSWARRESIPEPPRTPKRKS